MSENDTLHIKQEPAWQLLDEFSEPGELGGEQQLAQRASVGAKELGLPAAQVERIEKAVMAALRQGTQEENRNPHTSPVCIRIWSSGTGRSRSNPKAPRGAYQQSRGWGFFLIQKQEPEPQASVGESYHVVDLYIYQEREHSQRKRCA